MRTVLDHVGDVNGTELHRLAKLYPLPDFVKQASEAETRQPGKLSTSVYADPVHQHYPCHTSASTFLSSLFFAEKRGHYNQKIAAMVQKRLDHYITYWGIKAAVDAMQRRYDALHKNADDTLPDSDFAVVYVLDNGMKERHCRMKNAVEVKAAADWLFQYRDQLPFSDRNIVAKKITEKAARYGASLGAQDIFIEKQAGMGICDPDEVVAMLEDRARLAKNAMFKAAMLKLAHTTKTKPRMALAPDVLVKLAETVDIYDRANGLAGKYTEMIPRPEDVIFRVTLKEAKAGLGDAVPLTTGNIYDKTQFTKIKLSAIQDLFGNDVVSQVSNGLHVDAEKLAEVAETFPRPDAELFEQLLKETGIPPIATKRADDHNGIPMTAMAHLAESY